MQRFKIEYAIWISIVSFGIIVSFQHNLKELMLPHQLFTAPLISALHDKIHPFPFINTLSIYFFWENCQPPLFNKPPSTIRERRVHYFGLFIEQVSIQIASKDHMVIVGIVEHGRMRGIEQSDSDLVPGIKG